MSALQRVLERAPDETDQHRLPPYEYTIDEQRSFVITQLAKGISSFVKLVENRPKPFIIVTFLAILEMLQWQVITLVSGVNHEDFAIKAAAPIIDGGIPRFEQPPAKVRTIDITRDVEDIQETAHATNGEEVEE